VHPGQRAQIVALVNGDSLLPNLRSSKIQGQSNFVNPGIYILNFGADIDITPKMRGFININNAKTPAPGLETTIIEEVGSYGRQIGRIADALDVQPSGEFVARVRARTATERPRRRPSSAKDASNSRCFGPCSARTRPG